ncbi:hypothetical protein ABZV58_18370 [Nocardia sp. NPDC004654]|uniref:hypothetical protein n=1 Tax=Nocardia sp. NPDC004654 TaxID=3154776 RepID=UPI00339E020D
MGPQPGDSDAAGAGARCQLNESAVATGTRASRVQPIDPAPVAFDELFAAAPRRTGPHRFAGIPFAFPGSVTDTPIGQLHCAAGTIDDHGRLSDRSALKHLGWLVGQQISFQGDHQFIIAQPELHARWSIGRTGYLFIPAAFRHPCNISPADRVMIAAAPAHDILLVIPSAVVAAVLWAYRPEVWQKPE